MAAQQQQWQRDNGNGSGYSNARGYRIYTDGSGIGKCSDSNGNYFAIDLHMMVMAVGLAAPAPEVTAAARVAIAGTLQ